MASMRRTKTKSAVEIQRAADHAAWSTVDFNMVAMAMEADLGDEARTRIFETDERSAPKHKQGAGEKLFEKKLLDEVTNAWHSMQDVNEAVDCSLTYHVSALKDHDTMRDLQAEARGDMNMGQTHRLNRIAMGDTPSRRDSAIGFGHPGTRGFAADDKCVPRRPSAVSYGSVGAAASTNENLAAAMAFAQEVKKSGGKDAERKGSRKGNRYGLPVDTEFHSPRALSYPAAGRFSGQDARSSSARLPARIPGPHIPPPRGARAGGGLAPKVRPPPPIPPAKLPKVATTKSSRYEPRTSFDSSDEIESTPLRQRVAVPPPKLASADDFLKSISNGLAKSKHAPGGAIATAMSAATPHKFVAPTKENVVPATSCRPPFERPESAGTRDPSSPVTPTSVQYVRAETKLVPYADSSSPVAKLPSPEAATVKVDPISGGPPVYQLSESSSEMDFMDILDDCSVHSDEFEQEEEFVMVEQKPGRGKEGIMEDGTVYGGPYFLAAVIAAIPHFGNPKVAM